MNDLLESRRRHHRVSTHLPAEVAIPGTSVRHRGTILNVSLGGAAIRLDQPLLPGAFLTVRFWSGFEELAVAVTVVGVQRSYLSRSRFLRCRFSDLDLHRERGMQRLVMDLERRKLRFLAAV